MNLSAFFFFYVFVATAQGSLQLGFLECFTAKRLPWPRRIVYFICFYLGLVLSDLLLHSSLLSSLLNMGILYGASRLIMENKRPVSGIAALLASSIMQFAFGAVNSLACLILPYLPESPALGPGIAFCSSLVSLVFCHCCYRLTARHFSWDEDIACPYVYVLLAPLLFFLAIGFYIVNVSYGNVVTIPFPNEPAKHAGLFIIQLLGFCTVFSTLYAYQKLWENWGIKSRIALLEQESESQRAYVAEAKKRYDQTRSFRHDIRNHLSVLDGLIRSGSLKQAGDYLEKLNTVCASLTLPFHTGNAIVDILLCSKLEFTVQDDIETDISLTLPQPCAIDDFDLCVIFSNALDNALKACANVNVPRRIRVRGERQGSFYMLEFVNSCRPDPKGIKRTGTGLANIKAVAHKYGGAVTVEQNQDLFYLDILLNISLQQNDIS